MRFCSWSVRHWCICVNLLSSRMAFSIHDCKQSIEKKTKSFSHRLEVFIKPSMRLLVDDLIKHSSAVNTPNIWLGARGFTVNNTSNRPVWRWIPSGELVDMKAYWGAAEPDYRINTSGVISVASLINFKLPSSDACMSLGSVSTRQLYYFWHAEYCDQKRNYFACEVVEPKSATDNGESLKSKHSNTENALFRPSTWRVRVPVPMPRALLWLSLRDQTWSTTSRLSLVCLFGIMTLESVFSTSHRANSLPAHAFWA